MSGTSLDGIDAVLVDFGTPAPRVLAHHSLQFDESLRHRLLDLHSAGADELRRAALISRELATLYATATRQLLNRAGVVAASVCAIGCHGQTIRHDPAAGYTLQINQPALLAELTGITVVADFRSRDIAAGGQGAPLVPAFHAGLFRDASAHRVVLNLGGVANVTDLPATGEVRGFDTGPGNMLLDAWTSRHWQITFDEGGRLAATGRVIGGLLARLLADPYFELSPPKSTGRDRFHLAWLLGHLSGDENPVDVLATLTELTAASVAGGIREHCRGADEVLVCGGGAFNADLLARLARYLPETKLVQTQDFGIAALWVEAMAFAWLARQTLQGRPGNLPTVTGAAGPRVLGAIYPK